jgi:hypothetical protein
MDNRPRSSTVLGFKRMLRQSAHSSFPGLCGRLMPPGAARNLTAALEPTFADRRAGRAPTLWGARSARTKSRLKEGSQLLNVAEQ